MSTGTPSPTPKTSNDRKRRKEGTATPVRKNRRPTQNPKPAAEEDEYFSVKKILDETVRQGRTEYLLDWEGVDRSTGRPFKPTWEPARNVTLDAIEDWQKNKRTIAASESDVHGNGSSQPEASTQGSEAPTRPNDTRKRRLHSVGGFVSNTSSPEVSEQKRRRTDDTRRARLNRYLVLDSEDTKTGSSRNQTQGEPTQSTTTPSQDTSGRNLSRIVVELHQNPEFDPSEYQQVQLSETSQALSEASQGDDSIRVYSNRTIPDSQEVSGYSISDNTNSGALLDPALLLIESQNCTDLADTDHSQSEVHQTFGLGTGIPSHQPEQLTPEQVTTNLRSTSGFKSTSHSEPDAPDFQPSGRESSQPSERPGLGERNPGFLTQLPIDFNDATPTSSAGSATTSTAHHQSRSQQISENHSTQNHSVSGVTVTSQLSSQAAQVVPHSIDQSGGIQSQSRSERDFSICNDEDEIVPETVQQQPRVQQDSQNSSQALSELDGNSRISSSALLSREPASQHLSDKSSGENRAEVEADRLSSPDSHHLTRPASQSSDRPWATNSVPSARPVTPTIVMDRASVASTPPLSAKEKLRQIRARTFGQSIVDAPTAIAPPSTVTILESIVQESSANVPQPEQPVNLSVPVISPSLLVSTVEVDQREGIVPGFESRTDDALPFHEPPLVGPVFGSSTIETTYGTGLEDQPATLDPSALTLSIENDIVEPDTDVVGSPSIPTDDGLAPSTHLPESVIGHDDGPMPLDNGEMETYGGTVLPYILSGPNEYLITLPLAANIRPQYTDIIQEAGDDLATYNSAFTAVPFQPPEPALVSRVDDVFARLFDICDLPPFLETLPSLAPNQITKHIRGTNSKFAFVGQLLENLRHLQSTKKVLILARSGQIIDLLKNIIKTEGYNPFYMMAGTSTGRYPQVVMVASTSDDLSSLPVAFDVVIAYDHTCRPDILPPRDDGSPPLILALITSTSIQHINLRISDKIDPLDRKNMLMLALCASAPHMQSLDQGFPQPHEVAESFANFIEVPDNDDFYWTPQELPADIFENIVDSSQLEPMQSTSGAGGDAQRAPSRKRSRDEADEPSAKRPKMAQPEVVTTKIRNVPDSIKGLIGDDGVSSEGRPTVEITMERAEALTVKIVRLETELEKTRFQREEFRHLADRTKSEVDSWVASVNRLQPRYMVALKDRGTFEAERNATRKEAQNLKILLEKSTNEITTLKESNADLKQKLSEASESLINGTNPELAKMARLAKEAEEARSTAAASEKKVSITQNNMDYTRDQYQQASQRAIELKTENDDLQQQVVELTRKADANIVLVNQTQSRDEVRELSRLLAEQKAIIRERESELNRVREQLSSLKNGRRETRQSSVPRSPRLGALGIMSPRQGRGASGVTSGAGSRGTSPTAPLGVFEAGANAISGVGSRFAGQQQGNGRYSHLRD
ncbi:hypothetical protein BJ170DRAFT_598466 [Xylariales sp. AK1849]|nr:hypothetical protein BJ170DRAFT_598466 [Xylariales sp. AK1849]